MHYRGGQAVLAALLVTIGTSCMPLGTATESIDVVLPSGSFSIDALPRDVQDLGMDLRAADSSDAVLEVEAVEAAQAMHDFGSQPVRVDAYLVTATDPATLEGGSPIKDQPVWLVRFSDIEVFFPGPLPEEGAEEGGHTARFAYVLVDARSGDYLSTLWTP